MKNKHHKHDAEAEHKQQASEPAPQAADRGGAEMLPAPAPVLPAIDDRLLRLQADFENYRKRTQRERAEIATQANEHLMKELLPVLDHMDLALDSAAQHGAEGPVIEGFKLVSEQLRNTLAKAGLTPLDAVDQEFDPQKHEAISHVVSETVPSNRVVMQIRRGYMLGSRLLRPAQVIVSQGPAAEPGADAPAED
jgi:molecular chaperone GrpE